MAVKHGATADRPATRAILILNGFVAIAKACADRAVDLLVWVKARKSEAASAAAASIYCGIFKIYL